MTAAACILLAVLSVWDYPARQRSHEMLRAQFAEAARIGDTATMKETCEKGVKLLPDDPTWRYNLACSLAYFRKAGPTLDALEEAIDLGFRDAEAIAADTDLKRISREPRFAELVAYAREKRDQPILLGPMANVPATGVTGSTIALGEQNFAWDFESGCLLARLKLAEATAGGNTGDLYMNRDGGHSMLKVADFPGLTRVTLDAAGRQRKIDQDTPNVIFPYPLFGNASLGHTKGAYWRSLPRSMMTTESWKMKSYAKMYLSNQVWVFPAVDDFGPPGTNGDVFAAVTPYWAVTQGRSWSDQYYLKAALEASRSFDPAVKREIVKRGLLAPTIQMLLRSSLKPVTNEFCYLSGLAHPTCFPPNGLDLARLKRMASEMKASEIPPVVRLTVRARNIDYRGGWPELVYASPCAYSFVLRANVAEREFLVTAVGGSEFTCVQVHGDTAATKIEKVSPNTARVIVRRDRITVGDRVDVAAFARQDGSRWSAPSFVSFAVVDPDAPYSDPVLTPRSEPLSK